MITNVGFNVEKLPRTNLNIDGHLSHESPLQLVRGTKPDAKTSQPFITIAVIAYSHESYIEKCLSSINEILIESFELLIIDDGSPDNTLRKCLEFQFRPDIEVRVYTKSNRGPVHSLFCGLELARGKYLSFMASDDLYVEGGVESALYYLQSNELQIDALFCQAILFAPHKDSRLLYGSDMEKFFCCTPFDRLNVVCSHPPRPILLLQAIIFKTAFLRNLRPWEDNLVLDDWPTFIRLFAAEAFHAAIVRFEPSLKLCMYRMNEGGLSSNLDRQLKITTQIATSFVPLRYRKLCLANVRIGNGLIYLYRGRWWKGIGIVLKGILTSPTVPVFSRLAGRAFKFMQKRLRVTLDQIVKQVEH